jgi:hypothetical protein
MYQSAGREMNAIEDLSIAPQGRFILGAAVEIFKCKLRRPALGKQSELINVHSPAKIAAGIIASVH